MLDALRQRRQICCEQIEIIGSGHGFGRFAVGGAAAGGGRPRRDCVVPQPAYCWPCRSLLPSPPWRAKWWWIAVHGDRRVADRRRPAGPRLAGRRPFLDPAHRWREMLAQVFENRENLEQLRQIEQVSVYFKGEGATGSAWYMGAWILNPWKRREYTPQLHGRGRANRESRAGLSGGLGLSPRNVAGRRIA